MDIGVRLLLEDHLPHGTLGDQAFIKFGSDHWT